jgi:integration host factor subunit alpha
MPQKTVTRADLVDALVKDTQQSRSVRVDVLERLLAMIEAELVKGETVKLARFGNFVVREKRQRVGRNPKTGKEVPITPRRVVTFRPSPMLKGRVEKPPKKRAG